MLERVGRSLQPARDRIGANRVVNLEMGDVLTAETGFCTIAEIVKKSIW